MNKSQLSDPACTPRAPCLLFIARSALAQEIFESRACLAGTCMLCFSMFSCSKVKAPVPTGPPIRHQDIHNCLPASCRFASWRVDHFLGCAVHVILCLPCKCFYSKCLTRLRFTTRAAKQENGVTGICILNHSDVITVF